MPTHWISADTALSIIDDNLDGGPAHFALCKRAFDGLIQTKARLLVVGEARKEDVLIPKGFWWATGHEALEQDWSNGDFSTWIDRTIQWRAFGVVFSLDDLREMIPATKAALIARKLSVAGNPEWMAARGARTFMYNDLGANPLSAGQLLIDQCRLGFVAARAVLMQRSDSGNSLDWNFEAREWDVPVWYWTEMAIVGSSHQDWERGLFTGTGNGPRGNCFIALNDVHFARATIEALRPGQSAKPSEMAIPDRPRGRPPAQFWDDLWCAIWGAIYRGEFQPQAQADIERWMLDWTGAKDFELSESAAKTRARKLFAQYVSEGH